MEILLQLHNWCRDVLRVQPTSNTFNTLLRTLAAAAELSLCLSVSVSLCLCLSLSLSLCIQMHRPYTMTCFPHSDLYQGPKNICTGGTLALAGGH